ncbi:hypothetical protein SAMN05216215_105013 [Saccharopolyspora shandongensis]|uniref:Uncharacterized protein n=1 Tax=Saccharopolyspora shandongensis TaxID=418495 RepID=A0A1H3QVD3_9PSEU|nr:hypothetical protein [Saccharopolyspora shandongensis]SDZ17504.1 hypothetical protein SAMN05216215_105013 [Saccharopolyspora shandongensis]
MDAKSVGAHVRWLTHSLGRNPLRRRLDRVAAIAILALLAAAVLMVPAAIAAGKASYASAAGAAAVAAATGRPVEAVVTGTPEAHVIGGPENHSVTYSAEVSWIGADGNGYMDTTAVPPRTVLGSKIWVWVDRAEHITVAPPSESQLRASAVGFTVGIMVTGQLLCAVSIWGVRKIADACAVRAWSREWASVEAKWLEH